MAEQLAVGTETVGAKSLAHVAVQVDARPGSFPRTHRRELRYRVVRARFLPAGTDALLVELDDLDEALALHAEIGRRRAAGWGPSLVDVVPGATTVLLDGVDDPAGVAAEIESWTVAPVRAGAGPLLEIPCVYDGPDVGEVAEAWAVAEGDVGRLHASIVHQVAFCGFVPGFAYLTGIGDDRSVPRRARPRTTVPAGSVAVAGPYTGIYPRNSPGGWNLIGRTDVVLWDAGREVPALLSPGQQVRFVDAAR